MNTVKFGGAFFMVAAAFVFDVSAQTHSLRPYAHIASHGVNYVNTSYCAKPNSRFSVDYRLVNSSTKKQGVFGAMTVTSGQIQCAYYVPNNADNEIRWYYRSSGSDATDMSIRDQNRRVVTISHPAASGGTVVANLYDRSAPKKYTTAGTHTTASTAPLYLFALDSAGQYKAGKKEIYCFEAADDSSSVQPDAFFAPSTDAGGKAGFVNIVTGVFHGDAAASPTTALTFADGIGSAADYKFENGALFAKFRAFSADTQLGSVGTGDSEGSDSLETWVKRGESVTVKAIPADGCTFARWKGDTWAIAGGTTAKDASVVVTNTASAIQLLAAFNNVWYWRGGADEEGAKWFTPGNWTNANGVAASEFESGDSFVFASPGELTVDYNPSDSAFAVGTLTFAAGSGAVVVNGSAIAAIGKIVCENGAENVMSNAVAFTGNINVTPTAGFVRFAGGANGKVISNHLELYGDYNLSVADDCVLPANTVLKTGSTLSMLKGTFHKHNGDYTAESATTTTVANAKTEKASEVPGLVKRNDGVFVVTDTFRLKGAQNYTVTHYFNAELGDGVLVANYITASGALRFVPPKHMVMGPRGILLGTNCFVRVMNNGEHRFGAYADWEIGHTADGMAGNNPSFFKNESSTPCKVTFDTTDFYDSSVGRTITLRSRMGAYNADSLSVFVEGKGTLVFAYTSTFRAFSGGLTARDSSTVSVVPGGNPGVGSVTLEDSATLEVSGSGAVALGGKLTMGENATLAFRFSDAQTSPCLSVPQGAELPDTVNVKITSDFDEMPEKGSFVLVDGNAFAGKRINVVEGPVWMNSVNVNADGNIVLRPHGKGFMMIIR